MSDFDLPEERRPIRKQPAISGTLILLLALVVLVGIGVTMGAVMFFQNQADRDARESRWLAIDTAARFTTEPVDKTIAAEKAVEDRMIAEAERLGISHALRALKLEGRKDARQLKLRFMLSSENLNVIPSHLGDYRKKLISTAVKMAKVEFKDLENDERRFVLDNQWFFSPPE